LSGKLWVWDVTVLQSGYRWYVLDIYMFTMLVIILFFAASCSNQVEMVDGNAEQICPEIVSIFPDVKNSRMHLVSNIRVTFNCPLSEGNIKVSGVPGETHIAGNELVFSQKALYRPGTEYIVTVTATSQQGISMTPHVFSFLTRDLEGQIWIEVDLARIHKVFVYKGDALIKVMLASAGTEATPTPLGTFYISDKGKSFFAPRFGEGALYWMRFYKTYLFHSMPRDAAWNIKEEAVKKLGQPASHGCIRLLDEDAEWLFRNVSSGTMVIIHDFIR
jgi:lipoprotein-anchoring transpeptidase ErfK/SrfK